MRPKLTQLIWLFTSRINVASPVSERVLYEWHFGEKKKLSRKAHRGTSVLQADTFTCEIHWTSCQFFTQNPSNDSRLQWRNLLWWLLIQMQAVCFGGSQIYLLCHLGPGLYGEVARNNTVKAFLSSKRTVPRDAQRFSCFKTHAKQPCISVPSHTCSTSFFRLGGFHATISHDVD